MVGKRGTGSHENEKSTIHVFHFSSPGITAYFARTEQMEA